MFNFFRMMNDYEDRKVALYKEGKLMVSTAAVTDSDEPYETAVAHPQYNDGKIVIVEMYETKEDAQAGHDKWVVTMTDSPLPQILQDVSSADITKLCQSLGGIPPCEKAAQ